MVAGPLAGKAGNGGEAWVRLSWIRAFEKLGFRVYFFEQIDRAGDEQIRFFSDTTARFGLAGRCCLIETSTATTTGMNLAEAASAAADAALLVNISGHLKHPPLFDLFGRKLYIDLDPGFTQFWHDRGLLGDWLERHDAHFTVGLNVGRPQCTIPCGEIAWRPVFQPVALADWPCVPSGTFSRMTTVGSLRGPFGPVADNGRTLGLKIHEMRKFAGLPALVSAGLELAFHIEPGDRADRELLQRNGYRLVAPGSVAAGPEAFRSYVQGSDAEFSVAQGMYVETSSGWFSDRSVRYLASGKPVLVQDTGLSGSLPVGDGLLTFSTADEAAAGIEQIAGDYRRHCASARAIAEEYFEAGRVAGSVLAAEAAL